MDGQVRNTIGIETRIAAVTDRVLPGTVSFMWQSTSFARHYLVLFCPIHSGQSVVFVLYWYDGSTCLIGISNNNNKNNNNNNNNDKIEMKIIK